MSKDKNFRKLMTNVEDVERDKIWNSIKEEISQEANVDSIGSDTRVIVRKMSKRTSLFLIGIAILIIVLTVSSILIWQHLSEPKIRYCTIEDYHVEDTSITIKDYAAENKGVRYIDWYDDLAYCYTQHFKLNSTDEVICLYEQVISPEGYLCHQYVTDNKTELDVLSSFKSLCTETIQVKEVMVNWNIDGQDLYAMFEYKQFVYFLQVESNPESSYILNLVDKILTEK